MRWADRASRLEGGLHFSVRSSVKKPPQKHAHTETCTQRHAHTDAQPHKNPTASFKSGVGGISIESSEIKDWGGFGVSGVHGNVIGATVHVDSDVERAEI